MQKLKIALYGDPVLNVRANQIQRIDGEIERLAGRMVEIMDEYTGIGLAAPQVGVSKRLIVVQIAEEEKPLTLINPEITFRSGLKEKDEGCLSLPGITVPLKRAEKVRIVGTDLGGKSVKLEAEGLAARAFQHEVDHIDGMLITDRIGKKQLRTVAKQLEAIREGKIPALPED